MLWADRALANAQEAIRACLNESDAHEGPSPPPTP